LTVYGLSKAAKAGVVSATVPLDAVKEAARCPVEVAVYLKL